MTETTQIRVTSDPAETEETKALVKRSMAEVVKGKVNFSDVLQRVLNFKPTVVDKTPVRPKALTEDQKAAIQRLPEVFGQVVVAADRPLSKAEAKAIVEERGVIDTVIKVLTERKDKGIREVLANHMDHQVSEDQREGMRTDAKGHYAPWETQEFEVEGTDKKIQRFATGGKPQITYADIEQMEQDGVIDRKTYLALTRKPDTPRVLDEAGLHAAIQKDPALFFKIAQYAKPTTPTTTVKVV